MCSYMIATAHHIYCCNFYCKHFTIIFCQQNSSLSWTMWIWCSVISQPDPFPVLFGNLYIVFLKDLIITSVARFYLAKVFSFITVARITNLISKVINVVLLHGDCYLSMSSTAMAHDKFVHFSSNPTIGVKQRIVRSPIRAEDDCERLN